MKDAHIFTLTSYVRVINWKLLTNRYKGLDEKFRVSKSNEEMSFFDK